MSAHVCARLRMFQTETIISAIGDRALPARTRYKDPLFRTHNSGGVILGGRLTLSLADFDIICRVGDGSFSEVLHVRDKSSGYSYALKILDKHHVLRHKMVDQIKQARPDHTIGMHKAVRIKVFHAGSLTQRFVPRSNQT